MAYAGALRDIAIRTVTSLRPSLFWYKLDADVRRKVRFVEGHGHLDILRTADSKIIRISKRNAVYALDMSNHFDYYFGSARSDLIDFRGCRFNIVDFSSPRLQHIAGFDDFPILCPSVTEPYVTATQYLDFAALRLGDVVLDLGSYSGLTSIAFSKAVGPSGSVYALEPDPLNRAAAEQNLARHREVNGLDNVTLLPLAVSGQSGQIRLSSEGAMGSALTSLVGKSRGKGVDVECVTLQQLAERCGLDRVDFIKMDIEGAELQTILGSSDFLRRYRPAMIIEPHPVSNRMTSDDIIPFLESIDYDCKTITQFGVELPLVTASPDRKANTKTHVGH